MTADPTLKRQAGKVVRGLRRDYPDAQCALDYNSPFQLLVATVLSAQCTDLRVNIVTKVLFAKCPTAADLAVLPLQKVDRKSTRLNSSHVVRSYAVFCLKKKNKKKKKENILALLGVNRYCAGGIGTDSLCGYTDG